MVFNIRLQVRFHRIAQSLSLPMPLFLPLLPDQFPDLLVPSLGLGNLLLVDSHPANHLSDGVSLFIFDLLHDLIKLERVFGIENTTISVISYSVDATFDVLCDRVDKVCFRSGRERCDTVRTLGVVKAQEREPWLGESWARHFGIFSNFVVMKDGTGFVLSKRYSLR